MDRIEEEEGFNLDDKVAFVSGAASGIGKATSIAMQNHGAKVFEVDLAFEHGKALQLSEQCVRYGADLTNSSEVKSAIDHCERSFGWLDILVNCAGIEMSGNVVNLPEESFDRVMDTNVKSIFLLCKNAIPLMLKSSKSASIINLSSDLGIQPIPSVDAYAASKGAIIALSKAMSKNWAKSGLRVNCVAPGPVDTPLLRRFQDERTLEFVTENLIPAGRLGRPQEVANIICFLASDLASFINGAVITANGGLVG